MPRFRNESSEQRRARFEQFEQRLVMSGQPLAGLLPEMELAAPAITQQVIVQPLNLVSTAQNNQNVSPQNVSPTTAAAQVGAQYGFDGTGQTVAIIDSGIAWDHHALGGGFGPGHRVVGGWDFADNDANPFDSGAAGYHGTHVAGIVASQHDRFQGVSSGVDLVSLRVFNDQGQGNLEWVKQALKWVSDNRTAFENPITTVVMSLGTHWNDFTPPAWANLESQLAQLKGEGIFISVAAGNSFQEFQAPGLSYPAVSEHVVPVASHDANGNMSQFSQRADRVLVAPGESIPSTIPNNLFGTGGINRFMGMSGTSMAAPFVAGTSALLRQAKEFMGVEEINQDLIYQQLKNTADQIYDAATGSYYHRINLEAALASIVVDLDDNTPQTATQVGSVEGGERIIGTIGKLDDIDYFRFSATQSGMMKFSIEATHRLAPVIEVLGSSVTQDGNVFSFEVQAGTEYIFSIASSDGNGHYTIDLDLQTGPPPIQWGAISSRLFANQQISGEANYQFQATQNGFLTIQTNGQDSRSLTLELFNAHHQLVSSVSGQANQLRIDVDAKQGDLFYLKANGNASGIDFRLNNQVAFTNGHLSISGSNWNDTISVDARNGFEFRVNGIAYQFQSPEIQSIRIEGKGGTDRLSVNLGNQNDSVFTSVDRVHVSNHQFKILATGFEDVTIDGGGGHNTVLMHGSTGKDSLHANPWQTKFTGENFSTAVSGFSIVHAKSLGGHDRADLTGSDGNDVFRIRDGRTSMITTASVVVAEGFQQTRMDAGGGFDRAIFFESQGDHAFRLSGSFGAVHSLAHTTWGSGFESIQVIANQAVASVHFTDSSSNDIFRRDHQGASMVSSWYNNFAQGFHHVTATSVNGGNDIAHLVDTPGNDTFFSSGDMAKLWSTGNSVTVTGFSRVNAISQHGGMDKAIIHGTNQNDHLFSDSHSITLRDSQDRIRRVVGFQELNVDLKQGSNQTVLQSENHLTETLHVNSQRVKLENAVRQLEVKGSSNTRFSGSGSGSGSGDRVILEELNLLTAVGNRAVGYLNQHKVTAEDFATLEAKSIDTAMAEYELDIVDFQYLLRGNWQPRF